MLRAGVPGCGSEQLVGPQGTGDDQGRVTPALLEAGPLADEHVVKVCSSRGS